MAIRVLIFDDNQLLRESLAEVLDLTEGYQFVGGYEDCKKLLQVVNRHTPDVVLMDIDMPGLSGIEATHEIHQHFPAVRVLILTVFEDNDKIFNALCAGASGYLLKKASPDKILQAIAEVKEGGAPMSPSIAARVLQIFQTHYASSSATQFFDLSEKEKSILGALVKGLSYKMIAAEFSISINTVSFHLKNIYEKLHVHSASEAVGKAIRNKII
jgi:DNA-binding NarL/FixJ family response regulator